MSSVHDVQQQINMYNCQQRRHCNRVIGDFFNLRFYKALPPKVPHANSAEKPTKTYRNMRKMIKNPPKTDPKLTQRLKARLTFDKH